jgi:hypothetical protein
VAFGHFLRGQNAPRITPKIVEAALRRDADPSR